MADLGRLSRLVIGSLLFGCVLSAIVGVLVYYLIPNHPECPRNGTVIDPPDHCECPRNATVINPPECPRNETVTDPPVPPPSELRGVWLTTVFNDDWPLNATDPPQKQQQDLINYLNNLQILHFNAIFFHTRPAGDAFYNSSLEPWSKYLTGQQGLAPSPPWDPLEFIITNAHARGIQLHAWINPYVANRYPNTSGLVEGNMALRYPQHAYPYKDWLYMDPGAPEVEDWTMDVVADIVTRYDIDGLHIDDYFYPYPQSGWVINDTLTFDLYVTSGGNLSLEDWRRDNINGMIERLYNVCKSIKPDVVVSISPFGLYKPGQPDGMPAPIVGLDPYSALYADTRLWLHRGWLDMLIPQIYWEIDPPIQSYPVILDWWLEENVNNKIIVAGNALYKMFNWKDWNVTEIMRQIDVSRDPARREKGSLGNVFFMARYFMFNDKNVATIIRDEKYLEYVPVPDII